MDIFFDYAGRLDLRDKDGAPLVKWSTPEEAFEAWKECSRGRPCDYSGLSYDSSAAAAVSSGRAPTQAPDGTERLYEGGVFTAAPRRHARTSDTSSQTGAAFTQAEYTAIDPGGKAILKAAE